MAGIYIHIPFCTKVCTYCDFYKMVAKDSWKEKYVDYLLKELEMRKDLLGNIKTVYIGGGTPSSLKLELQTKIFEALKSYINVNDLTEFTIEANPDDITETLVKLWQENGINRISLGIQSLKKKKLKKLGRTHNSKTVKKAIKLITSSGIKNINADLIYGVGNEWFCKIKSDIKKLIRLGITHISTYSLIIEEKTIIKKQLNEGKFKPMDEEKDAKTYQRIRSFLAKKGFVHYEISNFAKPGFESKHNLTYWNNQNYLGLGAGASYYIDDTRYTNIMNLEAYYHGIDNGELNYLELSKLHKEEQMSEHVILGLRKMSGFNIKEFEERFELSVFDAFPIVTEKIENKILELSGDYLKVPADKLYLMNSILVDFV